MQINGREIGLRYTTGVRIEFAEFVRDNENDVLDRFNVLRIVRMSEAYTRKNGGTPLTEEELLDMEYADFAKLVKEADIVMDLDSRTTVEVDDKGKKEESAAGPSLTAPGSYSTGVSLG